jgi:ABC-type branched-subunit amino acid transport system ATPase component
VTTALTVAETLEAARTGWLPALAAEDVAWARSLVGLEAADRGLAGGLDTLGRRKLLIACLLMRRPRVLLLDEPCSGLLRDEIDEIDGIVRAVREELGLAVVVVEHRLELLFALADRVVVLDEGRVIAEGPPQAVFDEPAVREAYFETPRSAA